MSSEIPWVSNVEAERKTLFSHHSKYGLIGEVINFDYGDAHGNSIAVSVASDGSVKCCPVVRRLGTRLAYGSLSELFSIKSVSAPSLSEGEAWNGSQSSQSCSMADRRYQCTIKVDTTSTENTASTDKSYFQEDHALSLSSIGFTNLQISDSSSSKTANMHVLAYGGMAGLVRVHNFKL